MSDFKALLVTIAAIACCFLGFAFMAGTWPFKEE